jgi:hypothetical protein
MPNQEVQVLLQGRPGERRRMVCGWPNRGSSRRGRGFPIGRIPVHTDRAQLLDSNKRYPRRQPGPTGFFNLRYRHAETVSAYASVNVANRFGQVLRHVSGRSRAREYKPEIESAETAAFRGRLKTCPGKPAATEPITPRNAQEKVAMKLPSVRATDTTLKARGAHTLSAWRALLANPSVR